MISGTDTHHCPLILTDRRRSRSCLPDSSHASPPGSVTGPSALTTVSPMKRYNVTEGTRDEILDELRTYHQDKVIHRKDSMADELAAAITLIESGGVKARVRHLMYRVVVPDTLESAE